MRTISFKLISSFLLVWLPLFQISVIAQDFSTESSSFEGSGVDPFGGDPFGGMLDQENQGSSWELPQEELQAQPQNQSQTSPYSSSNTESSSPGSSYSQSGEITGGYEPESFQESVVQNAIIEGVQITTEQGVTPDEKVISGYFIFRDKPSSYFWEMKSREKKMVFEFHDTKTGSSPVPSVTESPIKGFTIEEGKVDINKDIRGLKPEWRNIIKVIFDLEAIPDVHVNDEFSIVSFSFKWTTDPTKIENYIVKDNTMKVVLLSSAGVGAVGLGALIYYLATKPGDPPPLEPLSIEDLPNREISKVK